MAASLYPLTAYNPEMDPRHDTEILGNWACIQARSLSKSAASFQKNLADFRFWTQKTRLSFATLLGYQSPGCLAVSAAMLGHRL
jgi:hypothetical protein